MPKPPMTETLKMPPVSTWTALVLTAALLLFGLADPERFITVTHGVNDVFVLMASDSVVIVSTLLLLGCGLIVCSPLGNIRLGEGAPEFSTISWLAMLFAAGMGSGLLYWGVAEPIIHLSEPPPYSLAMQNVENARMAMVISYLHWAFHPWAIYAVGAMCIAYFSFCKGHALLPSAPFRAMLPKRFHISQGVGDMVDITCVISTLLGLAAALAAGTMQIASGMQWLGHAPVEGNMFPTYLAIILILVAAYLISAATAIDKGIKRLSEINFILSLLLLGLIAFHMPVPRMLSVLVQSVGDYLRFLPELSFSTLRSAEQPLWGKTWTANYFLSWISWVPFVGIFVARISRGRSLRGFVLGVILAPSLFTFIWFTALGSTAIDIQLSGVRDLAADVLADTGSGLFSFFSLMPSAPLLWELIIALGFIFLITSADSASYVLAMMAARGKENPSIRSKLFWGLAIAALTLIALFTETGVHSVRSLFSFAGISVFFILIAQAICLGIALLRHKMPGYSYKLFMSRNAVYWMRIGQNR